jgi:GNAT superfamily N-acetyltransferase
VRPSDARAELTVRPANQASWEDMELVLGRMRCHGGRCYCQRYKMGWDQWPRTTDEERAHRLRVQTECGHPRATSTTGLVAYTGTEPVGWCAVEPRTSYPGLTNATVWSGRDEDKADPSVWSVTCFVVRTPYRRRGVSYALAVAAVDFARQRGARALEAYAMFTQPDRDITWGELHVGSRNALAAAGLREVRRPSKRRVVMRIDFRSAHDRRPNASGEGE